MKANGCVADGKLDRTKLTPLSRDGQPRPPQHPLGKPVRGGPEWFLAMDRNGDGDVSAREFTGPADVFDKLDLDKDGLLSRGRGRGKFRSSQSAYCCEVGQRLAPQSTRNEAAHGFECHSKSAAASLAEQVTYLTEPLPLR